MEEGRQDSFDSALLALKEALRGFIGDVVSEKVEEMKREGAIPSGRRPPVEIDEALVRESAAASDEMRTATGAEQVDAVRATAREVLLDALGDPETPASRMIADMVESAVGRARQDSAAESSGADEKIEASLRAVDERVAATLEAVRIPSEDAVLALVRREIRDQSGTGAVPSEALISEIARREAESAVTRMMPSASSPPDPSQLAAALSDESVRETIANLVRPMIPEARAEGAGVDQDAIVEKAVSEAGRVADEKIRSAIEEMSGRVREEAAQAAPAFDIESAAGQEKIKEAASAVVREVLAEEAKDLVVRIKADMQSGIDQKISDFASSAEFTRHVADSRSALGIPEEGVEGAARKAAELSIGSDAFKSAVETVVREAAASFKTTAEDLAEPMTALATKTTEKILAREAEGLVRQIKIELGKLRNDMKKGPDKGQVIEIAGGLIRDELAKLKTELQGMLASKDFKTLVAAVAGDALAPRIDAAAGKAASPEKIKEIASEAASEIADQVAKESLKGFLSEIGDRVEAGIAAKIDEFVKSDRLRETAGKLASDSVMGILFSEDAKEMIRGLAREGAGGGGAAGAGVDEEAVKAIVATELKRRTEEAFTDMIPRHVGKFLDEKLPPPEYFNSLITTAQLKAELDKRMTSSGASKSGGWGGAGGPGDSASFSSLVQRILNSEDLKEAMDDRFKVISNFVKNELVPKEVKKALKS